MNFRYFITWLYTLMFSVLSVVLIYESTADLLSLVIIIFVFISMTFILAFGLSRQEEKEIKHLLGRNGQEEKDYWEKR